MCVNNDAHYNVHYIHYNKVSSVRKGIKKNTQCGNTPINALLKLDKQKKYIKKTKMHIFKIITKRQKFFFLLQREWCGNRTMGRVLSPSVPLL